MVLTAAGFGARRQRVGHADGAGAAGPGAAVRSLNRRCFGLSRRWFYSERLWVWNGAEYLLWNCFPSVGQARGVGELRGGC